jgi:hypothetical protein
MCSYQDLETPTLLQLDPNLSDESDKTIKHDYESPAQPIVLFSNYNCDSLITVEENSNEYTLIRDASIVCKT